MKINYILTPPGQITINYDDDDGFMKQVCAFGGEEIPFAGLDKDSPEFMAALLAFLSKQ
jgi:hypothetical protein